MQFPTLTYLTCVAKWSSLHLCHLQFDRKFLEASMTVMWLVQIKIRLWVHTGWSGSKLLTKKVWLEYLQTKHVKISEITVTCIHLPPWKMRAISKISIFKWTKQTKGKPCLWCQEFSLSHIKANQIFYQPSHRAVFTSDLTNFILVGASWTLVRQSSLPWTVVTHRTSVVVRCCCALPCWAIKSWGTWACYSKAGTIISWCTSVTVVYSNVALFVWEWSRWTSCGCFWLLWTVVVCRADCIIW